MKSATLTIARIQARNVVRSRWILVYTGFFFALAEGLLRFAGGESKALLSLATASLMIIPLATLVLATIYIYTAREFTEVLLAQPIRRSALFAGLYGGLAIPATAAFVVGVAVPFVARGGFDPSVREAFVTLLLVASALTLAFTAIAFCIALRTEDRLKGVGVALGLWLLVAVLYDGLVLTVVALFGDYAIERPLLGLMFANPVDLARLLLLLRLDASALLGYTGAVFERFFAGAAGTWLAAAMLLLWIGVPVGLAARSFNRKDL